MPELKLVHSEPKRKKVKLPKYVHLRNGDKWYIRRSFPATERDALGRLKYIQIIRRVDPETPEQARIISEQIARMYKEVQVERARPLTVAEIVKECVDAKKTGVERKTDDYYQWLYRKYIEKADFGKRIAQEVTPRDVQQFYATFPTALMIRKFHTFLSMAFRQGVRWELIKRNPCEGVILPKAESKEIEIMSEPEAKKFMDLCMKKYPVLAFALESWCRPSEYLALRWADVHFDKKQVRINRAVSFTHGGGFSYKTTKSNAGKRTIGLTDKMAELLAALPRTSDLVFPNRKGTPQSPNNLAKRVMVKACTEAKIGAYSPYVLRHTGASIVLAHGANIKAVSERLGHSTIVQTLSTYAHVMKRSEDQTMKIIAGALY